MPTRHHETCSLVPIATKAMMRTIMGMKKDSAVKPPE